MEYQENSKFYKELDIWVSDQYRNYREIHEKLDEIASSYMCSTFSPIFQSQHNIPPATLIQTSPDVMTNSQTIIGINRRRFHLAPLHRRFFAEAIDICLIFIIKVALLRLIGGRELFSEFLEVIIFDFLDGLPGYRCFRSLNFLMRNFTLKHDPHILIHIEELTTEFMKPFLTKSLGLAGSLWILLRLIMEVIMISHPILGFGPGGCTVGKYLFNLRVVSCNQITRLSDAIEVLPGGDVSFWRSVLRSVMKNSSLFVWYSVMQSFLSRNDIFTYDYLASTSVVQVSDDLS